MAAMEPDRPPVYVHTGRSDSSCGPVGRAVPDMMVGLHKPRARPVPVEDESHNPCSSDTGDKLLAHVNHHTESLMQQWPLVAIGTAGCDIRIGASSLVLTLLWRIRVLDDRDREGE